MLLNQDEFNGAIDVKAFALTQATGWRAHYCGVWIILQAVKAKLAGRRGEKIKEPDEDTEGERLNRNWACCIAKQAEALAVKSRPLRQGLRHQ